MDTNRLKRFATEARNILMQGVAHRLSALGFLPDGSVTEEPQQQGGGATFMGDTVTQDFFDKWHSLHRAVTERSVAKVAEEAAYTWFNRLVAIRILVKNGLAAPVLEYESEDVLVPLLVSEARQGRLPEMDADSLRKLTALLEDDSKTSEQFALLIVAYCHGNPIINKCFGRISDYTELLLPSNILTEGGFVYLLNHTEFIAEEDFRSPELIGWLYQFYISERKDEVFAKKGKFEADEIPAATQIFTPNWIVKYMVQNTVGRIYLDNNPYETELQEKWQYLIYNLQCTMYNEASPAAQPIINSQPAAKPIINSQPPAKPIINSQPAAKPIINSQPAAQPIINSKPAAKPIINSKLYIINYSDLEELKVGDLACGSGHILNECFDLLYDLYIAEGYGRGKAIENIFRHNLTGVDIDTRAKQLATFSLLLKACQKDNSFADGHCLPNVLDMPEPEDSLNHFFGVFMHDMGEHSHALLEAVKLCNQARDLGSIMKFDITEQDRKDLAFCIERWEQEHETHELNHNANDVAIAKLILALTEKYHALVMNPPYMGGGNMNATLSKYVKEEYEEGKADLATVFVQMMAERTLKNGSYAFIIPPSWMFLSTFEKLRKNIIENNSIQSLLHLSRGVFGADFGASSAVIQNAANKEARGTYFRLVERTFQEFEQSHLRMLFEQTLANHDFKYRFKDYTKEVAELPYSEDGNRIYYPNVSQQDFEKIPGCPIGYWVSEIILDSFKHSNISELSPTYRGLQSGNVDFFSKIWFEVSHANIELSKNRAYIIKESNKKWFKFTNGGLGRKWCGNEDLVINWKNNGESIKATGKAIIPNENLYFSSCIGYNRLTSNGLKARYYDNGILCGDNTPFSPLSTHSLYIMGIMNSVISKFYMSVFNPTLAAQSGSVRQIPIIEGHKDIINSIISENISISKQDWDAHETSWDFEENPLLAVDEGTYIDNIHHEIERHKKKTGERICIDPAAPEMDSLERRMEQYKKKWEHLFMQLHENEEELNRQFIDIYGLQDELTPDVPLDEITILQQGEVTFNL